MPALSRIDLRHPADAAEARMAELLVVPPLADELGVMFRSAGHELHLVGGSVRDLALGNTDIPDLDFTTDATPDEVLALTGGWSEATWDMGVAFGTVGLRKSGERLEVTTFRTEQYDAGSRHPQVSFGSSLDEDLLRRDFTVNAMAISLPDHVFTAPPTALADLFYRRLQTPGTAIESFTDDPLRMLRALRFQARLGMRPSDEVLAAMTELAPEIATISAERVRDELTKILLAPDPVPALRQLVDTGLAAVVLPELPALRMPQESGRAHKDVFEHTLAVLQRAIEREFRLPDGGPDLLVRWSALLHDVAKPITRRYDERGRVSFHHHEVAGGRMAKVRLKALAYPKAVVEDVVLLVELHLRFHGYGSASSPWTDSAVRRYVTDAGDQLARLHVLVRSDCTTRNARKAAGLEAAYDTLEARIADLAAREELAAARKPDLNGDEVQALLRIAPGREVGDALKHLTALKMEHGPLGRERAIRELLAWGAKRGLPAAPPDGG